MAIENPNLKQELDDLEAMFSQSHQEQLNYLNLIDGLKLTYQHLYTKPLKPWSNEILEYATKNKIPFHVLEPLSVDTTIYQLQEYLNQNQTEIEQQKLKQWQFQKIIQELEDNKNQNNLKEILFEKFKEFDLDYQEDKRVIDNRIRWETMATYLTSLDQNKFQQLLKQKQYHPNIENYFINTRKNYYQNPQKQPLNKDALWLGEAYLNNQNPTNSKQYQNYFQLSYLRHWQKQLNSPLEPNLQANLNDNVPLSTKEELNQNLLKQFPNQIKDENLKDLSYFELAIRNAYFDVEKDVCDYLYENFDHQDIIKVMEKLPLDNETKHQLNIINTGEMTPQQATQYRQEILPVFVANVLFSDDANQTNQNLSRLYVLENDRTNNVYWNNQTFELKRKTNYLSRNDWVKAETKKVICFIMIRTKPKNIKNI